MAINRFYVISPLALIAVSACRSPYPGASSAVTGNIVKGPLSNALVFLDLDGDNVLDANEQSIRTDADGKFTINTTASSYKIVALTDDSTVDTSSGSVLAGVTLTAPKGAAVVTPTTTLMEEGGLTAEQVAEVLDLPDGVDPLTFNPFAAGVDATKALAVEKVSQQIMTAVSSFASAAEGAGASEKGAFTAALNSVVDVVKVKAEKINDPGAAAADKKIDFTKTADLDLIKAKVADEAEKIVNDEGTTGFSKAALTSLVSDTAASIKNVNDQIGAVTDLKSEASKNVFSTLQVLQDQVKNAAIAEKTTPGTGSIDFKDASKVTASAKNKAPTEIKLSIDTITEGTSNLLIGKLQTVDSDQKSGEKFKYEIVEIAGTDFVKFSMDKDTGAFSFKEEPAAGAYKVIIKSTDAGGKSFAKEVKINVQKDFHKDVIAKVNVTVSDYKKLDAYFKQLDGLEDDMAVAVKGAIDHVMKFEAEMKGMTSATPASGVSLTSPSGSQTFSLTSVSGSSGSSPSSGPTITNVSASKFTISFGGDYKATVYTAITDPLLTQAQSNPLALMGTESSPGIAQYNSWTVTNKVNDVVISKGGVDVVSASVSGQNNTELELTNLAVTTTGKVNKLKLTGDFSKFKFQDISHILSDINPSESSPGGTYSPSGSTTSPPTGAEHGGTTGGEHTDYSITKAEIFKKGNESTAVATSSIENKIMKLTMGDYKVEAEITGENFSADGSALFKLAGIDLLDLEDTVASKLSGTMTLSQGNAELLKAVTDMSALTGAKPVLGPEEVFGVYNGKMFMADSNYKAAAYFDFKEVELDAAKFDEVWKLFGDEETLPEIT